MIIDFKFNGTDDQVLARLREKEARVSPALIAGMNKWMAKLKTKVQLNIKRMTKTKTGRLLDSVQVVPAQERGGQIVGAVTSAGGDAFYGKILAAGTTKSWVIYPANGQVLAWLAGGKRFFAAYVFHPPLEPRPYMKNALKEMTPEIRAGLKATLSEALRG